MGVCVLGCFIHLLLFVTLWTDPAKFLCQGILQARMLEWVAMPSSEDLPSRYRNLHLLQLLLQADSSVATREAMTHHMTSYTENPGVNCGSFLLEIYISLCSYTMLYVKSFPKTFKTSRVMKLSVWPNSWLWIPEFPYHSFFLLIPLGFYWSMDFSPFFWFSQRNTRLFYFSHFADCTESSEEKNRVCILG